MFVLLPVMLSYLMVVRLFDANTDAEHAHINSHSLLSLALSSSSVPTMNFHPDTRPSTAAERKDITNTPTKDPESRPSTAGGREILDTPHRDSLDEEGKQHAPLVHSARVATLLPRSHTSIAHLTHSERTSTLLAPPSRGDLLLSHGTHHAREGTGLEEEKKSPDDPTSYLLHSLKHKFGAVRLWSGGDRCVVRMWLGCG